MKLTKKWGMILLAVWLILNGLMGVVSALAVIPGIVMALLAIAAGVLILIDR